MMIDDGYDGYVLMVADGYWWFSIVDGSLSI